MNQLIISLFAGFFLIFHPTNSVDLASQIPETTSEDVLLGIKLYKSGDTKSAIDTLKASVKKDKNNTAAWHYLGLAYYRTGNLKDARKSFENASKLQPKLLPAHVSLAHIALLNGDFREALKRAETSLTLDAKNADAHYIIGALRLQEGKLDEALAKAQTVLQLNSSYSLAYLLESQTLVRMFVNERLGQITASEKKVKKENENYRYLRDAALSLEKFLTLVPNPTEKQLWSDQLQTLKAYGQMAESGTLEKDIFPVSETMRPTILHREGAKYTVEARSAGVQGKVILLCIYGVDGLINHILVLQGLSHGLTDQAILAARNIKFSPAMKDGKPVSMVGRIEFNFNLF